VLLFLFPHLVVVLAIPVAVAAVGQSRQQEPPVFCSESKEEDEVATLHITPLSSPKSFRSDLCLANLAENPLDLLDTLDPVHSAAFAQMSSSLYT
jgi:hypothetical protein